MIFFKSQKYPNSTVKKIPVLSWNFRFVKLYLASLKAQLFRIPQNSSSFRVALSYLVYQGCQMIFFKSQKYPNSIVKKIPVLSWNFRFVKL